MPTAVSALSRASVSAARRRTIPVRSRLDRKQILLDLERRAVGVELQLSLV